MPKKQEIESKHKVPDAGANMIQNLDFENGSAAKTPPVEKCVKSKSHTPNTNSEDIKAILSLKNKSPEEVREAILGNGEIYFPQIRTKFVRDKIKEVRLNGISLSKIEEALDSKSVDLNRYDKSDFRYIAALINLENIIYRELQPDFRTWGMGSSYMEHFENDIYPRESLEIREELSPQPGRRELFEAEQKKIRERIAEKKKQKRERNIRYGKLFKKWWLENGGKLQ